MMHVNFQFPLSERTNCNSNAVNVTEAGTELSVSSIGTNELQQKISVGANDARHFQFPLSERTNCNDT